jgi:hypothetical protein
MCYGQYIGYALGRVSSLPVRDKFKYLILLINIIIGRTEIGGGVRYVAAENWIAAHDTLFLHPQTFAFGGEAKAKSLHQPQEML